MKVFADDTDEITYFRFLFCHFQWLLLSFKAMSRADRVSPTFCSRCCLNIVCLLDEIRICNNFVKRRLLNKSIF